MPRPRRCGGGPVTHRRSWRWQPGRAGCWPRPDGRPTRPSFEPKRRPSRWIAPGCASALRLKLYADIAATPPQPEAQAHWTAAYQSYDQVLDWADLHQRLSSATTSEPCTQPCGSFGCVASRLTTSTRPGNAGGSMPARQHVWVCDSCRSTGLQTCQGVVIPATRPLPV